ncbi:MAG: DUF4332 domain-containing protein [Myxococcaceae bacterium]|nr:DUF4332 domain-containing protein [Myxococcaceae bacterium]
MPAIDSKPTSLSSLRGLEPAEVAALKKAGVTNNAQLLEATKTRAGAKSLAKATGLTATRMKEAVNRADLARIDGIGGAAADLFENAGVNSVKELATRNPTALHATLVSYAASRTDVDYTVPSANTVKSLVAKAVEATKGVTPPPVTQSPQEVATEGLHQHIDTVLFGTDPAGASFRRAILDGRTPDQQAALKARMHAEVAGFFSHPDTEYHEGPTTNGWAGRLLDLYTEVHVKKTGGLDRVYVEID